MKTAYLILENGITFKGKAFGAEQEALGEIVFTTAMTGYLETLTDPSYYGQIVLQTFPLIGNYGVIPEDFESKRISLFAYIVKYPCDQPSNFRSKESLDELLKRHKIPGLCGIDTRKLTKIIRTHGVLNGKIMYIEPTERDREEAAMYKLSGPVKQVSRPGEGQCNELAANSLKKIALINCGAKGGIEDALVKRACKVMHYTHEASVSEILSSRPAGVLLSNGPGDPSDPANRQTIETIRELDKKGIPIMGICLGHQLLALAKGFSTRKMKFGHRGANQAVKDTTTGRVYITSQNHGYEVDVNTENECIKGMFINVNDGTNEGLDYGLSFSVQFHPEAQGGPLDTSFLFDRFLERLEKIDVSINGDYPYALR